MKGVGKDLAAERIATWAPEGMLQGFRGFRYYCWGLAGIGIGIGIDTGGDGAVGCELESILSGPRISML
jgi:hypothetical protein